MKKKILFLIKEALMSFQSPDISFRHYLPDPILKRSEVKHLVLSTNSILSLFLFSQAELCIFFLQFISGNKLSRKSISNENDRSNIHLAEKARVLLCTQIRLWPKASSSQTSTEAGLGNSCLFTRVYLQSIVVWCWLSCLICKWH